MDSNVITRAALGRIAAVGTLYDIRSDKFCGVNIIDNGVEPSVTVVKNHRSDLRLSHSDSYTEKFSNLNVNGSLQLSVLSGLCSLEGSGKYINDEKTSARSVKSSLVLHLKTVVQALNLNDRSITNQLAFQLIQQRKATHVVQQVHWGADLIATCKYANKENKDVTEASGKLKAYIQKLKALRLGRTEGQVGGNYSNNEVSESLEIDVTFHGDILPPAGQMLNLETALDFMAKPDLLNDCNNGWGKPISYELIPVDSLMSCIANRVTILYRNLEGECITQIVQLFQEVSDEQQKLNDLLDDAIEFKCVGREIIQEIADFKKNVTQDISKLKIEASALLVNVRSQEAEINELNLLLKRFEDGCSSPAKIRHKLIEWNHVRERIEFVRLFIENGAEYVAQGDSLDNILHRDIRKHVCMLCFVSNVNTMARERWIRDKTIFLNELERKTENQKFYVVNCDYLQQSILPTGLLSCVMTVKAGQLVPQPHVNCIGAPNEVEVIIEFSRKNPTQPQINTNIGEPLINSPLIRIPLLEMDRRKLEMLVNSVRQRTVYEET